MDAMGLYDELYSVSMAYTLINSGLITFAHIR